MATETPSVDYSMTHYIRYWPEEADYESCDYSCVIEVPEFSMEHTSGSAFNKAVKEYTDGLKERIESGYLPSSVAEKPHTEVTCAVEYVGRVTNVVFTEEHSYEAQPYVETYVLMLDERGNELNLCDIFLDYHAEARVAEYVSAVTKETGRNDLFASEASKVLTGINITHGAKATETGCIVFVKEGVIAPYEAGEIAIPIDYEAVSPDFIGENGVMTLDEYRSLVDLLRYTADAAVVREENIRDSVLSPFEATSFMGEAVRTFGLKSEAGRLKVPEAEFEDYYLRCFGVGFPGVDTYAHDIRHENGVYSVLDKAKQYECHVDMLSVSASDGVVTIEGDLIDGSFGYASTEFLCHVTVTVERSASSPFGFRLIDFVMGL